MSNRNAPKPLLSPLEEKTLALLAKGTPYKMIAYHMQISVYHVHTLCHSIRKKTGIATTKDQRACLEYWTALHADHLGILPARTFMPSKAQMGVLSLLAKGKSYAEIAETLGINTQTAMNHASQGCQKIGIGGYGQYRVPALIEWMKKHHVWVEPDPLDSF